MRLDEQDEVSSVALCELQKLEEDIEIPTVKPEIDLTAEEDTLEEPEEENGETNGEPVELDEGKEDHDQENLPPTSSSPRTDDNENHENTDQDDDDNKSAQSDDED